MSRKTIYSGMMVISAIAGGYLAYQSNAPFNKSAATSDNERAAISRAQEKLPDKTEVLVTVPSPSIQANEVQTNEVNLRTIKERFGVDHDPMLIMALGEFSDQEIDAYNELHIIPFNRVTGQDCIEKPFSSLPEFMQTNCKTVREFPAHPYESLDDAALQELAQTDAAASLLFGQRQINEVDRLSWYLRAVALSEKSGPLLALAERRYGQPYEFRTVDGKLQPKPRPDNVVTRLSLEIIAKKLNDPRANPEEWRKRLREVAEGEAEQLEKQAESQAYEYMNQMSQIQRDITGSTQMEEAINA